MPNEKDLDKEVIAIGKLMGILTGDNSNLSINQGWFTAPVTELETMDERLSCLVDLLSYILPQPTSNPPPVFLDAQWFPIPSPKTKANTAFHVVMSLKDSSVVGAGAQAADAAGQIGLGVLHSFEVKSLTIETFIYVPLFSYDASGAKFIADSKDHACQVGLYCSTRDKFQVDGVSFTAMKIDSSIFLAAQEPTFALTFENLQGTTAPSNYSTLQSLLDPTVASWIGEVIIQGQSWLQLKIGSSPNTVGEVLVAAGFLTKDSTGKYDLSLANLKGDATKISLNFVFAALNALADLNTPLITLPEGGVYITYRDNADSSRDYGIRFVTDLALTAKPAVDLCLGTWLSGETDTSNWIEQISQKLDPGLFIFLLKHQSTGESFAPSFELCSVGVNVKGGGDASLIELNGYTLKGAEVRAFLDSTDWTFGFAIQLDEVGFPLGPSFGESQSGGTNPVAKNLLASGDQQAGSSDKSAVNPGFSAKAAYISGKDPLLEILDPQGHKTDLIWFPIQRRLGPLNCEKVGLKVDVTGDFKDDPLLSVIFDGGVSLGGLDLYLDELSLGIKLKNVADISGYSLDLQGLDVSFSAGSVEVSGGLMKATHKDGSIAYNGDALIKYQNLTIAALGSYASLPDNGGTSLFIFAVLNYPIGGPAFFFVTGLMAGFGYNRSLKIPAADNVQNFPLLSGLVNSSAIGGSNPSPQDALSKLDDWVPPERGEYWLAAGVQFTTFEVINTNALLIVEFGKDFIISVLGVSTLKQPQVGTAYVYAELEIEVVFLPREGELKASAVLAPSSYVLTPEAHLTGGFAFYAWFGDNEHAGDFVFTIGGYHPAFKVPLHYPQEPRLGINWQISDVLSMVGEAYFAITPTAMMAGGGLALTFADGPLKAWLKAQTDIILFWKPFYLIADASVSIGISFRIHFLFVDVTLSVEIGAEFHLWGPPIGGTVHIDWYIISFTIGFGADKGGPPPLSWEDFKGMLPSKPPVQDSPQTKVARVPRAMLAMAATAPAADTTNTAPASTPAYLHITANKGLKSAQTIQGLTMWLVRPAQFQFTVGSAVPATSLVVTGTDDEGKRLDKTFTGKKVALRQVNGGISGDNYQSTQTITLLKLKSNGADEIAGLRACMATETPCTTQPSNCQAEPQDMQVWEIDVNTGDLPQAMWGDPIPSGQSTDINPTTPTVTGTMGVTMIPKTPDLICTPEMNIEDVFADRIVNADDTFRLPLSETQAPFINTPQVVDSFVDITHVNDDALAGKRGALFAALQTLSINGWTNEPLPQMAAHPGLDFADEPMEGSPVSAPLS